jgi:hypothetical protein
MALGKVTAWLEETESTVTKHAVVKYLKIQQQHSLWDINKTNTYLDILTLYLPYIMHLVHGGRYWINNVSG